MTETRTRPSPPSRRVERIALPSPAPGTTRSLAVFHYGAADARPRAYLQAALHADELPGPLVAHHLLRRLDAIDAEGGIRGSIVLVPCANPIGLDQFHLGRLQGRFEHGEGQNFNRGYADLADAAIAAVAAQPGDDADATVQCARTAMREAMALRRPVGALETLRHHLLTMAIDADIALDLHSDNDAVLHLYLGSRLWPQGADLAAQIGARAVMLELASGGHPFDEACSVPWARLAEHFPDRPIPQACLSATVELRGENAVDDATAAGDADNLLRFLARRGVIDLDPGPLPAPLCEPGPLSGVDVIRAPVAGIVVYHRHPSDTVEAGALVAEIVDPVADDPTRARTPLFSRTRGVFVGRRLDRMAVPGRRLCEIAGAEPLPDRSGYLSSP